MDIQTLIADSPKLPGSPQILPKLTRLLRDSESSMTDIVELIKLDAGLAAQIVRLSNSAYYGMSERCVSVDDSINRIGFDEVFKLVGAVASNEVLSSGLPLYGIDEGGLWEYSILVAALMQSMHKYGMTDRDTAYTTGLLHGLGKVVLNNYYMENGLPNYDPSFGPLPTDKEKELLGFTNPEVAATLLEEWNFTDAICTAIRNQYQALDSTEHYHLTLLLSLSRVTIPQIQGDPEALYDFEPDPVALGELNLSKEELVDEALNAQSTVEWLATTL